jgi:protein SCO1/2
MTAPRSRLALVCAAFVAGLALCFGAIALFAGANFGAMLRFSPTNFTARALAPAQIGGPFRLVDQNGVAVSDQDMKGKPFLVFFGFTHCPDVCPTTLFDVSEVLRSLGPDADRTGALFITVDPERDTASALKDYLSSFDPHLRGLTGDPGALAAVAKEYRVYYKKVPLDGGDYTMDHTAIVYLMDKDGRFVAPFSLKRKPDVAAAELRKYL